MANRAGPQRALGTRGQTINADAWPYFDALLRAVVKETGANYDDLITEATRIWARQNYLYVNRNKPGFNPAWPPDDARAFHVAGNAVDFGAGAGYRGTPVQRALHRIGPTLGIFFEISNELWHGAFDKTRAPKTIPTTVAAKTATVITPEEPDMKLIQSPNRGIGVVGPGHAKVLTPEELPYAVRRYGYPSYIGNDREFDLEVAIHSGGVVPAADAAQAAAVLAKLEELQGAVS